MQCQPLASTYVHTHIHTWYPHNYYAGIPPPRTYTQNGRKAIERVIKQNSGLHTLHAHK